MLLEAGAFTGQSYWIEDWWDRVVGRSWMDCDGNPACLEYAVRSATTDRAPIDNRVVYGKIGGAGKLIHVDYLPAATEPVPA